MDEQIKKLVDFIDGWQREVMYEKARKIVELMHGWRREAMDLVPDEYALHNVIYKYFTLDNKAAGLRRAADELEELLIELGLISED